MFQFSVWSHFHLFLIIWLGHKDPEKCQRTRSMIHTSARSESNFKYLVLLAFFVFSIDILYVSTTLITLSNVHITSIFIYPYQSHVKLKIYAVLLCKNISESTLFLVGADRKEGFWLIWEAYIKFNWCRDLISSHRGYKYMLDSYSDSVLITTQRSNDLIIISEVSSHFILYLKFISVIN